MKQINEEKIRAILEDYNKKQIHQQDLVQYQGDIARCLCKGTHGSAPHLTKTLVIIEQ